MKVPLTCLILGVFFGIISPQGAAEQKQTPQQLGQEIEILKTQISEIKSQLQTVENIDKMELLKNYADVQLKLADSNAKLANVDIANLRRDLKDYNDEWLGKWGDRFVTLTLGIIGIAVTLLLGVGGVSLHWLKTKTHKLVSDKVDKSLNGFKKTTGQVDMLKNQLQMLEKEHVAFVLNDFAHHLLQNENRHPESIKALREEALLVVLGDDRASVMLRCKTAVVLATRKSSRLLSPLLGFLNGVVDTDVEIGYETEQSLRSCVSILANIHTNETYQGLSGFLNRLLAGNLRLREVFLTWTVFALADVGVQLNMTNSAKMLKGAITHLNLRGEREGPIVLATLFDKANAPENLREILIIHGESLAPDVVDKYLKLLQKHDPEFVEKWRAENTTDDTESA